MNLVHVNEAQENLDQLVDQVAEYHQPIVIASHHNHAVLIAQEDWNAIQASLYLNTIPGMVESIHKAAQEPLEDCIELKDLNG